MNIGIFFYIKNVHRYVVSQVPRLDLNLDPWYHDLTVSEPSLTDKRSTLDFTLLLTMKYRIHQVVSGKSCAR